MYTPLEPSIVEIECLEVRGPDQEMSTLKPRYLKLCVNVRVHVKDMFVPA